MSITRRIFFGAAASWFSRGVTILMGLVLMPVLFRNLGKEELGLWLLIGQSWVALGILDLGFGTTLTRRIAFAKAKSGSDPKAELGPETLSDVAKILGVGRRIYSALAVSAFCISFAAGFFYLKSLHLQHVSVATVWTAWSILCLSQAIGVWAMPWTCLLQGVGYIGWDAIFASLVTALTLIAQMVAVLLGSGLVPLAIIAAIGAVTQRFLVLGFSRRKRPELFSLHQRWDTPTFRTLLNPAMRAWLTALGVFMVGYTDQFFVSTVRGVEQLPAYRAAWVLVHNLTICAVAFGVGSGVFVSHLWQAEQLVELHRVVIRSARLGLLLMLAALGALSVAGESLFNLWLGRGNFIGYPVLLVFLISETLETQSYIISTASRATEDEAFAFTSLAAGTLKLLLSFIMIQSLGLLGLALATAVALVLTNHWYMVYRGLGRLRISFTGYLREVLLPCAAFVASSTAILWLLMRVLHEAGNVVQVAMVAVVTAAMLAIAVWRIVLEPSQRSRVLRWTGVAAS